jgi:hypothetical protein
MNFFKIALYYFILFNFLLSNAQIAIGTRVPNKDAMLDVFSDSKGVLLPRVALFSTISSSPLSSHVAGMMVYNVLKSSDVTPGYYFNDGLKWVRVSLVNSILNTESELPTIIDGKQLYAIRGRFSSNGTTSALTISLPEGIKSYHSIIIYKQNGSIYRNIVTDIDVNSTSNNLITGNGIFNEVYPAGVYDYVLEYFK